MTPYAWYENTIGFLQVSNKCFAYVLLRNFLEKNGVPVLIFGRLKRWPELLSTPTTQVHQGGFEIQKT